MPGVTENKNPFSSLPRPQIVTSGKASQEVARNKFNVNAARKFVRYIYKADSLDSECKLFN